MISLPYQPRIDLTRLLWITGGIAALFIIYFFIWWNQKSIEVEGTQKPAGPASPITGLPCPAYERRPIAVMLASDPVARPLSGISQADAVVEMPVTPGGITRLMAVFQCESPKEIGSVRSARSDFIPLAAGFGAIYAHWGGERDALEQLKHGIINNIDALAYEGTAFFRKTGVKPPHNGFTTLDRLLDTAKKINYGTENVFSGYAHSEKKPERSISNLAETISIDYPSPYDVRWVYDSDAKVYKRFRNNSPETDKNSNQQVSASTVVVVRTTSQPVRDQYISVGVEGQGQATVYRDGVLTNGTWSKDGQNLASKLVIRDAAGKEIPFAPGVLWIEIVAENAP